MFITIHFTNHIHFFVFQISRLNCNFRPKFYSGAFKINVCWKLARYFLDSCLIFDKIGHMQQPPILISRHHIWAGVRVNQISPYCWPYSQTYIISPIQVHTYRYVLRPNPLYRILTNEWWTLRTGQANRPKWLISLIFSTVYRP